MGLTDYKTQLLDAALPYTPWEIHGLLCGALSGGQRLDDIEQGMAAWLDLDPAESIPLAPALEALYEDTLTRLKSSGFEFDLLLPDEDQSLGQQVYALGQWCEGFISGLGQAGVVHTSSLSEDAAEALEDIASIAKIADLEDEDEGDEEVENDFTQLHEYVRIAVLLLFTELQAAAEKPTYH